VTDINDLFSELPIGDIAKQLGLSKDEAAKGVALALPALFSGLQANAADPKGEASLVSALQGKDTSLIDGGISLADVVTKDGKKIVKHIFGSSTKGVASTLGSKSSLSSTTMKSLMAILAPIVLAYIVKKLTGEDSKPTSKSKSSGGGIGDILGQVLAGAAGGSGGSGGGIGDILGQVLGGAVGGGSTSKSSSTNAITAILGGLLGGGTK
jgi:hypothetical protein